MALPLLSQATVIITGAARGIGFATAQAFARAGAKVVLGDRDTVELKRATAAVGPAAQGFLLDVTSQSSFASFIEQAESAVGEVDILVNNAGVMPLGAFLEQGEKPQRMAMDVNFWGVVNGCQLILPRMVTRNRGHIVNVASMMGKVPVPGAAVYTASKHAVVGFSAALRDELAGTGVSLATVLPSATRTELLSGVPTGRGMPTVSPQQVAEVILKTCHHDAAEFPVPGWLRCYEVFAAITPEKLMHRVRRLLHHTRVMTGIDHQKRQRYESRING